MRWNKTDQLRTRFSFICDQTWDAMSPTECDAIRQCGQCGTTVHNVTTRGEFEAHARQGHCVRVVTDDDVLIARPTPSWPALWVVVDGGEPRRFAGPVIRIGSAPGPEGIRLDSLQPVHAVLTIHETGWVSIEPAGDAALWMDGKPVNSTKTVLPKQKIHLGGETSGPVLHWIDRGRPPNARVITPSDDHPPRVLVGQVIAPPPKTVSSPSRLGTLGGLLLLGALLSAVWLLVQSLT